MTFYANQSLVSSISNFFTNESSLANKWMSFSFSKSALVLIGVKWNHCLTSSFPLISFLPTFCFSYDSFKLFYSLSRSVDHKIEKIWEKIPSWVVKRIWDQEFLKQSHWFIQGFHISNLILCTRTTITQIPLQKYFRNKIKNQPEILEIEWLQIILKSFSSGYLSILSSLSQVSNQF